MSNQNPLTSKSGESEWLYGKTTIIAVEYNGCARCIFRKTGDCPYWNNTEWPDCVKEFDLTDGIMYVRKPAEK